MEPRQGHDSVLSPERCTKNEKKIAKTDKWVKLVLAAVLITSVDSSSIGDIIAASFGSGVLIWQMVNLLRGFLQL